MKHSVLKHFTYLLMIVILLTFGIFLITKNYLQAAYSFDFHYVYLTFISLVFFGGVGLLLGWSNKNFSFKASSSLKLNKVKLVLLGVPSLFVSLSYVWIVLGLYPPSFIIHELNAIIFISNVVFGHTIISSIQKKSTQDA